MGEEGGGGVGTWSQRKPETSKKWGQQEQEVRSNTAGRHGKAYGVGQIRMPGYWEGI